MTSRLPAGTSIRDGVNRMPWACTATRVVSPVACAAAVSLSATSAAGSAATPTATASTSAASPVAGPPRARPIPRGPGSSRGRGGGGSAFILRDARIARNARGRKPASPIRTRTEHSTRARLGTGSTQSSRPPLTSVIRNAPARSSSVFATRTAAGPPPSTTGIRYDSAPSSTWAPNPAASGTARASSRVPTADHDGADATATTSTVRDAASQAAAATRPRWGTTPAASRARWRRTLADHDQPAEVAPPSPSAARPGGLARRARRRAPRSPPMVSTASSRCLRHSGTYTPTIASVPKHSATRPTTSGAGEHQHTGRRRTPRGRRTRPDAVAPPPVRARLQCRPNPSTSSIPCTSGSRARVTGARRPSRIRAASSPPSSARTAGSNNPARRHRMAVADRCGSRAVTAAVLVVVPGATQLEPAGTRLAERQQVRALGPRRTLRGRRGRSRDAPHRRSRDGGLPPRAADSGSA